MIKILVIAGPFLSLIVYILVFANMFIYFMGLLPVIYTVHGTLYSWLSTTFGLYLVLGIWFNHSMGMSIKPGFLRDYYLPEETSEEKEMRIHDIKRHKDIEPFGEDMKILMEFAHSDMDSILNYSEMR